jgi:hypothetical protein
LSEAAPDLGNFDFDGGESAAQGGEGADDPADSGPEPKPQQVPVLIGQKKPEQAAEQREE